MIALLLWGTPLSALANDLDRAYQPQSLVCFSEETATRMLLELEAGRILGEEHKVALEGIGRCEEMLLIKGSIIEALEWEKELSKQQLERERELCQEQISAAEPAWYSTLMKVIIGVAVGIAVGLAL